jgi:hypothetical protein
MGDHATLHQLLNSPPGTVIRERRGAALSGMTLGGIPTQAEYRSAHRAGSFPARPHTAAGYYQRRLEELEQLIVEPYEKLDAWG